MMMFNYRWMGEETPFGIVFLFSRIETKVFGVSKGVGK